jgi:hypothetical protein
VSAPGAPGGYQPVGPLRRQVREAICRWLRAGDIPNLDRVHATYPRRLDFGYPGVGPHRAQAVVFLTAESEVRLALGGPHSGKKRIIYSVDLELYHHSVAREPGEAMDHFDQMIDQLKDQIRADHQFGDDTGTVFQAAEGPYGIQIAYERPAQVNSEAIETWARLSFQVESIVTA